MAFKNDIIATCYATDVTLSLNHSFSLVNHAAYLPLYPSYHHNYGDILFKYHKKPRKDALNYYTFTIHETYKRNVKLLERIIKDYKHLENLIILTIKEFSNANKNDIVDLLLNNIIMKAVLKQTKGGAKTIDNINLLKNATKDNHFFKEALKFVEEKKINGHNISMLIRNLKKDYNNHLNRVKNNIHSNAPKAKKLNKVNNYSITLEPSKFTLKKRDHIGLNFFDKMHYFKIPFKGKLSKELDNIESIRVSLSHGHIYYNISYAKKAKELTIKTKHQQFLEAKIAAGDIGVINTLSLFINDQDTPSVILGGSNLINYNCYYNKTIAKLNTEISNHVAEYKEITLKDGSKRKIPVEYNQKGKQLRNKKKHLTEKRNRFFKETFTQMAVNVVKYLKQHQVTTMVLSKNLNHVKNKGSIEQNKKTKQKFYQIPFGKFINTLEGLLIKEGIRVKLIDESHTSKSSFLSDDVAKLQEKAKDVKLLTTDYNGSRVKRGLYRDTLLNFTYNADMNGAANHIKVAFPSIEYEFTKVLKIKLTMPYKFKSNSDFRQFINGFKTTKAD